MQENVAVADGAITGTLKHLTEGQLVETWGEGNLLALKFTIPEGYDPEDVLVGLDPSEGSGLVPLDADLNGAFKVTATTQKFKTVIDGHTQEYSLAGLTLAEE